MKTEHHQGACLCGAVRFALTAEPTEILRCHCRMCQKAHGAPFAVFARFPNDAFIVHAGADRIGTYRSSAEARRTFCRDCGSALQFIRDNAETFGLSLSALDTPMEPRPIGEYHPESAAGWWRGPSWEVPGQESCGSP